MDENGRVVVRIKQLVQCARYVGESAASKAMKEQGAAAELAHLLGHGGNLNTATWGHHKCRRVSQGAMMPRSRICRLALMMPTIMSCSSSRLCNASWAIAHHPSGSRACPLNGNVGLAWRRRRKRWGRVHAPRRRAPLLRAGSPQRPVSGTSARCHTAIVLFPSWLPSPQP